MSMFGKPSYDNQSTNSYDEVNRFAIKGGKPGEQVHTIFRIIPPMHKCAERGVWVVWEPIHWGYYSVDKKDPTKRMARPFKCIKDKNTTCPECNLIEEYTEARKKLDPTEGKEKDKRTLSDEEMMLLAPLEEFLDGVGPKREGAHRLDKKWKLNVYMRAEQKAGTLRISSELYSLIKARKGFESKAPGLIDTYLKDGLDLIDANEGVWFNVTRTGSGFGTKYSNPATLPGGQGYDVAFSPDSLNIALAFNSASPYIFVYPWSALGFGTKYANPVVPPPDNGFGVAWSTVGDAKYPQVIAVAHDQTPYISAYPWSGNGFGTKYTNAATLAGSSGSGVTFSSDGLTIAVATGGTPYISAYPWSSSGFGTKYSNPATLPTGYAYGVAFSPDGLNIAVAHTITPYISAYPWSGSGFGTKYSNPATLPTGDGRSVAFSPDGLNIAVAHLTTPFITAYPWSGSGFGTKYANPSTLPTGTAYGVAFSPDGLNIAVSHDSSPRISVYPWSAGFGTKYSDPASLPAGQGNGVAFSPDGLNIALAMIATPYITAYPWSGSSFGTKYANPATLPTGVGFGVAFSPDSLAIAVAHNSSPHISAYPWSGSGFGTKYANPATLPPNAGNGVAFTQIIS